MDRYELYVPENETQMIVDIKSHLIGFVDKDEPGIDEFDFSAVKDPKPKRLTILTNEMKAWVRDNTDKLF